MTKIFHEFRLLSFIIFVVGCIASMAYAAYELPAEPVHAADQTNITPQTLNHEYAQYQSIGKWLAVKDDIKTTEMRRDKLKKDYERYKKLHEQKYITEDTLKMAEFRYKNSEVEVKALNSQLRKFKAQAEIHRLNILHKGNPDQDHRYHIATAMKTSYVAVKEELRHDLRKATNSLMFKRFRFENGKKLLKKKVISQQEFDDRELAYFEAQDEVDRIKFIINAVEVAIKGVDRSIDRLTP